MKEQKFFNSPSLAEYNSIKRFFYKVIIFWILFGGVLVAVSGWYGYRWFQERAMYVMHVKKAQSFEPLTMRKKELLAIADESEKIKNKQTHYQNQVKSPFPIIEFLFSLPSSFVIQSFSIKKKSVHLTVQTSPYQAIKKLVGMLEKNELFGTVTLESIKAMPGGSSFIGVVQATVQ